MFSQHYVSKWWTNAKGYSLGPVRVCSPVSTCLGLSLGKMTIYQHRIHSEQCANFYTGHFQLENKLNTIVSENDHFHKETNADQRQWSFSAHCQLVLDRNKPIRSFCTDSIQPKRALCRIRNFRISLRNLIWSRINDRTKAKSKVPEQWDKFKIGLRSTLA